MTAATLPLPAEPRALQSVARTLLDQAPATGLPLIVAGGWIADPLWQWWGASLRERGLDRAAFGRIVTEYGNELRLWVVGERPWEHYAGGLAGRVERRLDPPRALLAGERHEPWRTALDRVGVPADAEMAALVSRIGELSLLYDISAPDCQPESAPAAETVFAIVWAGARPRDAEVPFGEGRSGAASGALAEALGRFLLKDPAYPPK